MPSLKKRSGFEGWRLCSFFKQNAFLWVLLSQRQIKPSVEENIDNTRWIKTKARYCLQYLAIEYAKKKKKEN